MGEHSLENNPSRIRCWLNLLAGMVLIWAFIWVLAPIVDNASMVKPLVDFIESRDIDASALYYTEIEEFSTASFFMDNSNSYHPKTP